MTKIILIGTGTPNPNPYRKGPCVAILHNTDLVLFDIGTGAVRNIQKVSKQIGVKINDIKHCFITHLHSDHTLGLSDLIITPWILGRKEPLHLYGPLGLDHMTESILSAYQIDIKERIHGLEKANTSGIKVITHQAEATTIGDVTITPFPVVHGNFESYGYKITTPDTSIVISGDTAPCEALIKEAKNVDYLIHEVYYTAGLKTRSDQWQKYHSSVHTSALDLGKIAEQSSVKNLILYHQLFMQENVLDDDLKNNDLYFEDAIVNEIKMSYNGNIIYGKDLMII